MSIINIKWSKKGEKRNLEYCFSYCFNEDQDIRNTTLPSLPFTPFLSSSLLYHLKKYYFKKWDANAINREELEWLQKRSLTMRKI